jgi:hypothetical protein
MAGIAKKRSKHAVYRIFAAICTVLVPDPQPPLRLSTNFSNSPLSIHAVLALFCQI